MSVIGNDFDETILKFDNLSITTNNVYFKDITIYGAHFKNQGNFTAENVIFKNGEGQLVGEFPKSYGGSIYTSYTTSHIPHKILLKNCTFVDNKAQYGGAIYINNGDLEIESCLFINNWALQYGGAIAIEKANKVNIQNSTFIGDISQYDAGGAVYIIDSTLNGSNFSVLNCSATFGSAIASLNSNVILDYLNITNNIAKYDGGAIYQIYGRLDVKNSEFSNNHANNGAGLFLDNLTSANIINNTFLNNSAMKYAGAIYSLSNSQIVIENNSYIDNIAEINNDTYFTTLINQIIKDLNYTQFRLEEVNITNLPSYYNLLDYGYVSPVKDQEDGGNCWAYSIIAALESSILKASNITYDLSEGNVKNLMAKYSDYGWNKQVNHGGNDNMAIGYLTGWLGPVLESEDLSDEHDLISPLINPLLHVQNVIFLKRDNYLDNKLIKEAIMKYGGVVTGMLISSQYLYDSNYYYYGSEYTDHSVVIIGWDDNYSKYNFAHTPPGNGAFIVKNSWGEEWGDNGYFYVSYYDTRFAQVGEEDVTYAFPLNDTIKYEKNYQYDIQGKTNYFFTGKKSVWYENIFTASDDEYLAAVSTYFETLSNWEVYVYVNDTLKITKYGISNAGYYTFNLGDLITLKKGDQFKIVFKVSTKRLANVPVSEFKSLNKLSYQKGVSFISYDGNQWIDLYDYDTKPQVACIKAFTISNKLNSTITVKIVEKGINFVVLEANPYDIYGNKLNTGQIIFNLGESAYNINVNNSNAALNYTFEKSGVYNFTAKFISQNYFMSFTNINVLVDAHLDFSFDNITYGDKIIVNPILVDSQGFKLTELLNMTVSNHTYLIENSQFIIPDIFDVGDYEITLSTYSLMVTKLLKVSKRESISQISVINHGVNVTVNILINDEVNKNVEVYINDLRYSLDDDGNIYLLNLSNGDYSVNVNYNGDNNYLDVLNSTKFNVNLENPNLIVTVGDSVIGDDLNLTISINENVTGKININIDDLNYEFNLPISSLNPGVHNLTVYFEGDDKFSSQISKTTFNVVEFVPKITSDSKTVLYTQSASFMAAVYGFNGRIAVNEIVTFKIGKIIIKTKTNANGVASFKITQTPGTYSVKITSLGISTMDKLKVNQILALKKVNVRQASKKVFLKASLKKINGKYLKGKKITFKFNGKKYTVKTNKMGVAKIIIKLNKLKKGKKIKYSATYQKTNVFRTLKVKK